MRKWIATPSVLTLLAYLIYALSQFVLLAVLAQWFGARGVGQFALALALLTPVSLFLGMRMRSLRVTESSRFGYVQFRVVRDVAGILIVLAGLTTPLLVSELDLGISLGVALMRWGDLSFDLLYASQQLARRFPATLLSQLVRGAVIVVVAGLGRLLEFEIGVIVTIVGAAGLLLAMMSQAIFNRRNSGRQTERRLFGSNADLLRVGLPMGVSAAIVSAISLMPRYGLAHFHDAEHVGRFAVAMYPTVVMTLLATSLGQTSLSAYTGSGGFGLRSRNFRLLAKYGSVVAVAGALGTVLLLVLGDPVLAGVFGSEFAGLASASAILMLSVTIGGLASLLYFACMHRRQYAGQMRVYALVLLAVIALTLVLVPDRGVVGAAWALVGAMSLQLVLFSRLLVIPPARAR